jgi:hypothetical protein
LQRTAGFFETYGETMIVSIDDFEAYTGKRVEDSAGLQIYIDSATDIIKNYIGYDPETSFNTEYIKGYNSNKLQLKHKPVVFVYTITDYLTGEVLFEATHPITRNYYMASEEFVSFKDLIFPDRKLIVEYISGFGYIDSTDYAIDGGNAFTTEWAATYDCGFSDSEHRINVIFGGYAKAAGAADIGAATIGAADMPSIFKQTTLRIAALLATEANDNIGVTSKQFGDSGSRTFINYTNFDKYLLPLSKYKLIVI